MHEPLGVDLIVERREGEPSARPVEASVPVWSRSRFIVALVAVISWLGEGSLNTYSSQQRVPLILWITFFVQYLMQKKTTMQARRMPTAFRKKFQGSKFMPLKKL